MTRYFVTRDSDEPPSFGIIAVENGKTAGCVPSVFPLREQAEEAAYMMNELALEPCHLEDVIEDWLTDFSL